MMIKLRRLTAALMVTALMMGAATLPSYAGDTDRADMMDKQHAMFVDYSDAAFEAAQAAGKHIVIDVWKWGCPTCRAQKPTLKHATSLYPDAVFLKVNYRKQKDVVKQFNVPRQSTIIVFRGETETGRVIAETDKDKLLALIATGA